ncbi:MAG TPA: potassium:proton antiporter [Alcanivorax sp.]|jgi:monovalent cation:proton antiporter-2 (CPA2) family protein|nr:potassium:proton antiporter [Alcanivorax sp.]MBF48250.1 potassium:proton antiporter [Alcanivorax sp.]HAD45929.1 potassium:proton antiporter [Alcanivorax sp.]HAI33770.1 potassium:proton antiporter [Alcanivorax sp.]HAI90605.1 potassium:proton antiporter [Alcanivorax sp.]|tara:strand:- start:6407 stop:8188 length:1782 start_codon:yes stop_codon:yes gene_type:complete
MGGYFNQALVLLAAAVLLLPLFQRLGLGSILGYLAAGIVIGPLGLGLIPGAEAVLHFAELGVVLMLFLVGLELAPEQLWAQRRRLLGLGASQMLFSAALLTGFFFALGQPGPAALAIGATLALSSTAFAVQMLVETNQLGTPQGRNAFSILLFQDLAVIPLLLLLPVLAGGDAGAAQPNLLVGVLVLALMWLAGRYLLNPWLGWLARLHNRELMTATALLLVLGAAELMETLHLSMGLGAFVAGMLLANSPYREQLDTDIQPFKGMLLGLFFIAIGMTMDLRLLAASPWSILAMGAALLGIKTLVLFGIARTLKVGGRDALRFGLLLSQGGEFAFVLFTQAGALNLLPTEMIAKLNLVVALSMAATPLLLKLVQRLWPAPKTGHRSTEDEPAPHGQPAVIVAGFGRFGQIIGRILVSRRIPFTALDSNPDHIDTVRRFGNEVYFGDVTRLDLLHTAGLQHARIMVLAIDDVQASLRAVRLIREHFPHITLIVRARDRYHAYSLMAEGVEHVIRETLDSSLRAAQTTLAQLGMPETTAIDLVRTFRDVDERLLREQFAHRDKLDKLIELSARGREELESLLEAGSDDGRRDGGP